MCSECGHELFCSTSKFEHSSPWPAFSKTIHEDSVSKEPEAWGPVKVKSHMSNQNDVGHICFAFHAEHVIKITSCFSCLVRDVLINALQVSCGRCGNGLGHEFLYDGPAEGLSRF